MTSTTQIRTPENTNNTMYRVSRSIFPRVSKPISATPAFGQHQPFTTPFSTTPTSQSSNVNTPSPLLPEILTSHKAPYSTAPTPKTQPPQATPAAPSKQTTTPDTTPSTPPAPKKTQSQLDEELRAQMEGLSGDGGASGVEYEDGQPVAMKRSVKDNMFRYI